MEHWLFDVDANLAPSAGGLPYKSAGYSVQHTKREVKVS